MQRNKRNYILTQRSLPYTRYLNLYSYGFYGGGMSVTNMAYEIATGMGFKNLVLIGQDLAYGKSGESHIKEYKHPYLHDGDYERHKGKFQTTAYGGEGMAESSEVWTLFRQVFENYIEMNNDVIKTYNCTEGGARIAGSIEIPFKQACKEFFNKPIKKPFAKVPKPSRKEQNENMLQAYTKIKKGLKSAEGFIKKCKKVQKQIEALTRGKQNQTIESINNAIDSIKERIENKKSLFTNEILSPPLYHQESQLTPLYVQNISNEGEKQNKLMAWIFSHEAWLEEIIDLCSVLIMRLKYDIIPLQDLLEKRKLL